jgi:hypothetical protein
MQRASKGRGKDGCVRRTAVVISLLGAEEDLASSVFAVSPCRVG